jgi:hypothetical protein
LIRYSREQLACQVRLAGPGLYISDRNNL